MYQRLVRLPTNNSFFLFGPRGTGKSTLLQTLFPADSCLWINLLQPEEEDRFQRNPGELRELTKALDEHVKHVVIDEVQKLPRLLDVVHELIESTNKLFVMTGSSARKLKHGGANLLAGRAFVYHLDTLAFLELGKDFNLDRALSFGLLPRIYQLENDEERARFLESYVFTYLKEEIWAEHVVRKLDPFRHFLEVAAQNNGKIINYSRIADDVGIDDKTVREYYAILEDTLVGFFLDPFHSSFRKRLSQKPKFYFFDTGVSRALARLLQLPLLPQTKAYGDAFEHLVIAECLKIARCYNLPYRFCYLRTKDDAEIDLIVDRPGQTTLLIEIKSGTRVSEESLSSFRHLASDFPNSEAVCFCQEPRAKQIGDILALPWQEGIRRYFVKDYGF